MPASGTSRTNFYLNICPCDRFRFGLEANQPAQVVLVPGGRQPLVGNAHLEGPVLPQQVVRDALQDGRVVGGGARADAAVVLA